MTPEELEAFEERAAIMEYEAGMTRVTAERFAREIVCGRKSSGQGYESFRNFLNRKGRYGNQA